MDRPTPDCPHHCRNESQLRRPANCVAWFGFSFSLLALLLLWATILAMILQGKPNIRVAAEIALCIDALLFLAGLVLSIVGLRKASRRGEMKKVSVTGLIFTTLTLLSFIIPIIISTMKRPEHTRVELPETTVESTDEANRVVALVVDGDELRCYDNRLQADEDPLEISMTDSEQIERALGEWFKIHGIAVDDRIRLEAPRDASYDEVSVLLTTLNKLGMTRFTIKTSVES